MVPAAPGQGAAGRPSGLPAMRFPPLPTRPPIRIRPCTRRTEERGQATDPVPGRDGFPLGVNRTADSLRCRGLGESRDADRGIRDPGRTICAHNDHARRRRRSVSCPPGSWDGRAIPVQALSRRRSGSRHRRRPGLQSRRTSPAAEGKGSPMPRGPPASRAAHTVRYGCWARFPSCVGPTAIGGTGKALCGPVFLPRHHRRALDRVVPRGAESCFGRPGTRCGCPWRRPGAVFARAAWSGFRERDHSVGAARACSRGPAVRAPVCGFSGPGGSGIRTSPPAWSGAGRPPAFPAGSGRGIWILRSSVPSV